MAERRCLGASGPCGRWPPDQGGAADRNPGNPPQSVFHRRSGRHDADVRLGRCLEVHAERLRRCGTDHGACCRRGELRPRAQSAAGDQGRRTQLSRHLQRAGLAADLDAGDEPHRAARCVRGTGLRRRRAAAGGLGGSRCDLDARLRCGDDEGRPLRARRRLHDRRRRGSYPERRLRHLLEELRHRRGQPAGGRDRHRRWRGAHRQCVQRSRAVLGHQGRRRRQSGRRHARHAEDARSAGLVRRRVRDDRGGIGCRVPPPDRRVHRSVSQPTVQSVLGRERGVPSRQHAGDLDGVAGARTSSRRRMSGGRSSIGLPGRHASLPSCRSR